MVKVTTSKIEITDSICRSLKQRGIPEQYHHQSLGTSEDKKAKESFKFLTDRLNLFKKGGYVRNYISTSEVDRRIYMLLVKSLYLNGVNVMHLTSHKIMSYLEDKDDSIQELYDYDALSIDDFYDTEELINAVDKSTLYKYQGFLQDWLNGSGSLLLYSTTELNSMKGFSKNMLNTFKECEIIV